MPAGRHSITALTLTLAAALAMGALATATEFAHASTASSPAITALSADVRRNVVWYATPEAAPRTLHIESTSIDAPSPDEFQITYTGGNFTLVYQRVAGGPITNQYTLSVAGLVEWNDTAGNGEIQDGTVVAYTPLGPNAFGRYPIQHTRFNASATARVDSFLILSNKGEITLNLTIADGFVQLSSDKSLTPMEAKLTFTMNHTMTAPDTRLSLQIGLSTSQRVTLENQSWDDEYHFSTDDRAVNITNDAGNVPSTAFFAWSNTAEVNNVTGAVIPSELRENATSGYDLYLTYPRVTTDLQLRIVHDPILGVVSAAYLSTLHPPPGPPLPFQADVVIYAVSLAAIALAVAGTALWVRRRRQPGP